MAKLSFFGEVVCVTLLTSFILWQETAAVSLSTQISTLPPNTTFHPKAAVCDGVNCSIGRKCAIDENHRPVCVCIDECPYAEDMVCGTNGRTYGNECQLQKETCPTDKGIRVAYKTFCLKGSVCYGHQCPSDKPCTVSQNNQPVCLCIQSCPYDYYPVCGSNGVTYDNLCWLKREACIKGTNITMARTGPCIYTKYCEGVVCPSPKFCVVDLKNQTSCGCRDDNYCGDYYAPVCGSDNKTYDNQCHMAAVACKTNTNITLRYSGVCSEGPNCQEIVCPTGKHCDSVNQPEPKCVCDTVCPKFFSSVCGNNNKTYNNYCELKREACLTNTAITWRFNGRCDEGPGCTYTYCTNGRKCVIDERHQPICACPQYCSSNSKEVCGTDNKTYTNECFLNVAACLTNKSITVQRLDQCREVATVCDGFFCPKGMQCAIDESNKPVCVCIDKCPYNTSIVCGSDGRTYGNECELQKEVCTSNTDTRVAYKGYCLEGSVCSGHRCPLDKQCSVNQYNQPVCVCIQSCPSDYNPVCGSDGVTYNNLCELKKQACTTGKNVTVARTGKCIYIDHCNGVVCPSPKSCVVDAENQTSCVCKDDCGDYYFPVCGSDNKTYGGYCQMNAYACQTNISLTILYYGACSEGSNCQGISCPYDTHCDSQHQPEPRCVCDTVCPKTYTPICGSNNKTYNNSCELQRDACLTKTSITQQFNRRCEEVPECNFAYNCPYGQTCALDERNQPMCVCSLNCYAGYTEVCGTDNKTYSSDCLLRAAACMTNKTISVQRYERCK